MMQLPRSLPKYQHGHSLASFKAAAVPHARGLGLLGESHNNQEQFSEGAPSIGKYDERRSSKTAEVSWLSINTLYRVFAS